MNGGDIALVCVIMKRMTRNEVMNIFFFDCFCDCRNGLMNYLLLTRLQDVLEIGKC